MPDWAAGEIEAVMVVTIVVVLFRVARPFVSVGLGVCCD